MVKNNNNTVSHHSYCLYFSLFKYRSRAFITYRLSPIILCVLFLCRVILPYYDSNAILLCKESSTAEERECMLDEVLHKKQLAPVITVPYLSSTFFRPLLPPSILVRHIPPWHVLY